MIDTTIWPRLYIPMGSYLRYAIAKRCCEAQIALQHHQRNQYKVNIRRPPCVYNWGWTDVISEKTFSLEKLEEAIAHAHELIDSEVDSILPY